MTEALKMKARDELITSFEKETGNKFTALPERQKSIAATKFYLHEIHNSLGAYISEDDLDEGLVDGKNDLGCDFIYRDDGHVVIVQTKFRASGVEEASAEISHFQSILKRIRNLSLNPNKYLADILPDLDWDNDTFELVFVTFGKLAGQARKISAQQASYPDDIPGLEVRCEWKFFDEHELNVELRNARNLQRNAAEKTIQLYPIGEKGKRGAESVVEIDAGGYKSYIMALDANQLIRCYQDLDRDSLFSLNIRNYIGSTSTNKNILKSAEEDPDNFFLYNNGISCLATKVNVFKDRLEIVGLQVINGAQTVKAFVNLANSHRLRKSEPWKNPHVPNVLVRVSEIPDNYGRDAKVREKITQYNNTQNTIRISDFRSNDDVQANLKQQFGEIYRFGKKVVYLPKRTDKVPPNSEMIRLEEFAKSVYAFLYDPTAFSGSSSFLFTLEKNGGYISVFGDGTKLWEKMPEDEFKLRAAIYWIAQEFASRLKLIRDDEGSPDSRAALERKWLLVYAASVVFRLKYKDEWKNKVRQLYKGDWRIEDAQKGGQIMRIFDMAKAGLIMAYTNSKNNKVGFVHRNWMRSKDTPGEIAHTIETVIVPLMPL